MTRLAAILAATLYTLPALAAEPVAPVIGLARPPIGWVEFCEREPAECRGDSSAPMDVVLSPDAWATLARVNLMVNASITPMTDLEHWGVGEKWSYPDDGFGDCEDYALAKRRLLLRAGWPRSALLMTVVRDGDEGHAVLTVKTDRGDYVLDNRDNEIRLWSHTGYRFVSRQSQTDPNVWVRLGEPAPSKIVRMGY